MARILDAMAGGLWVLQRTDSPRFPYRLQILQGDRPRIVLWVQDRWPAAGQNIFCLREKEPPTDDGLLEEVERVPLAALQWRAPRLSVVLQRPRYKRCDFLFLRKTYKGRSGQGYEQIFWQTQLSMRQRRPRIRRSSPALKDEFLVRIASEERYPWKFAGWPVERGRLDAGDYALVHEGGVMAVVERKTFENFLSDLGTMPLLH